MQRWDRLLESHLDECQGRGLCSATVESRSRELGRWGNWLKRRRPRPKLEEVNADLVIQYVRSRTAFKAKATVSGVMSQMRGMGDFLVRQGIWSSSPLHWLRGPKLDGRARVPRRIGAEDMTRLWEGTTTVRSGFHQYLWLTAVALLYGTGIRRGELERLNLSDWNRDEGLLLVDGRKTGQQRRVPLPELACRCLESYLPQRQNRLEVAGRIEEPALLINKNGGRLDGRSISSGIQRVAQRCGLPHLTLHQFRHTCASDLLEGGTRLPEVQRLLGHQTITTTMRYLHIADPQRHAAVRLHPINQMLGAVGTTGVKEPSHE